MKRRLPFHSQKVWPSFTGVVVFFAIYGIFSGGIGLFLRFNGSRLNENDLDGIHNFEGIILGTAAVAYAVYRLMRFHPACNRAYAAWLKSSPWTYAAPLPAGPVHPVWQDAAVIGFLTAMAKWLAHIDVVIPLSSFALAYTSLLTMILAATRTWSYFLLSLYLWPTFMLTHMKDWPSTILAVALVVVLWLGTSRSFQRFPWPPWASAQKFTATGTIQFSDIRFDGSEAEPMRLGFPYYTLSPKIKPRTVKPPMSLAISALAGWWVYCVMKAAGAGPMPAGGILLFAMFVAGIRLAAYCIGVTTPFNIWGRIYSRQFILPDFDKVFLTPLAIIATGVLGGIFIEHTNSWHAGADSLVITILLLVAFNGGPSLRSWLLTGAVRFHAPAYQRRSQLMTRRT